MPNRKKNLATRQSTASAKPHAYSSDPESDARQTARHLHVVDDLADYPTILTINSGSSSLKASLFLPNGTRQNYRFEHIGHGFPHDHHEAFAALMEAMGGVKPDAVGHRMVHGGNITEAARLIDDAERERLQTLVALAPLHLPGNLLGVDLCLTHFPGPQVACYDTAFHGTMPELAWRLPIPQRFGLRRYGFHGINYAWIASQLPALLSNTQASGHVIVAHLGNGASLCHLHALRSIDTTMGYTPSGGVPMGTRSGDLDPGVMLALGQQLGPTELEHAVYHEMGLLALSDGESNEMSELLASPTSTAAFAVDYFARQIRGAIGALAAKNGGVDALVFTGGIGEHASEVRKKIMDGLHTIGFALNQQANQQHKTYLHTNYSKPILIIPADEEQMIHKLVLQVMASHPNSPAQRPA